LKSFEEGLIPNFTKTWGTKNIFNPIFWTTNGVLLLVFSLINSTY